jgi:putative NADH-flavin reductase
MRIAILGASGRTGAHVLKRALEAGHEVVAFARTPDKVGIQNKHLSVRALDLTRGDTVGILAEGFAGTGAIISALGPDSKGKPAVMSAAADAILAAARKAGVGRLVWMTGAGVKLEGDPPSLVRSVVRGIMYLAAGDVLRDSEAAARLIAKSELDWTIVRAPMLSDEPSSGRLEASRTPPRPTALSRDEIAGFLLDCAAGAAGPGGWSREAPFLSMAAGK